MISVEARKYHEGCWVLVREWDGYDRPDYTPIFKITKEELEFEGGRFTRKGWMPINNKELIIAIPNFGLQPPKLEETINWVAANTSDKWNFEIFTAIDPRFIWKFHFESERDAAAFKLRWSKIDGNIEEFYPGQWR